MSPQVLIEPVFFGLFIIVNKSIDGLIGDSRITSEVIPHSFNSSFYLLRTLISEESFNDERSELRIFI